MNNSDINPKPLIDALIDQMRYFGAASAELSADIPTLGVRFTVKVKEVNQ